MRAQGLEPQALTVDDETITTFETLKTNRNIIINGDFEWAQRGSSWVAAANNIYPVDRFQYAKSGTMVHTLTQHAGPPGSSGPPTVAQSGHRSFYTLKADCTTADASIAAGDRVTISTLIEGYDYNTVAGLEGTLSFWVKATKTGIYCAIFKAGGSDGSYIVEYTVNSSNTWEKKTMTVLFDESVGTWGHTSDTGLYIGWCLASGSTYQTTPNTWQSGNYIATSNQVNACDSASNDFELAQVKFEVGTEATPFIPRPSGEEFALCQRYYEFGSIIIRGLAYAAGSKLTVPYAYQVIKRTTPTITLNLVTDGGSNATVNQEKNHTSCLSISAESTDATDNVYVSATFEADAEL